MDGPWQIGHKTAAEYGRIAQETAKVMRWVDPTVQLAACGSSQIENMRHRGWPEASRLLEEIYNVEDALVVGGALITLMNNADRVKVACLAQLVNVIGPIMTEPGGAAWRQTIFYPFALASRHGHGRVMQSQVESPSYSTKDFSEMPYLVSCVVDNPVDGTTVIFAMNRHLQDTMELNVELRGLGTKRSLVSATEVHDPQLKAANTLEQPNAVVPHTLETVWVYGEKVKAHLKPCSWNVIVTKAQNQT